MALGNTPRRETNISVEANKSYAFGLRFKKKDGTPVDVTGCTVRLVAAEPAHTGGNEVLSIDAEHRVESTGIVQFNMQAEDLALEPSSYAYNVTLYPPSGYSTPILKGYIEVGSNTDLDTSNTYTNLNVGSEISAVFEDVDLVDVVIERVDGLYEETQALINEFTAEMTAEVDEAAASAAAAAASQALAQSYAASMQTWLDNAGFPFWKGTQAEYDLINPKQPDILYLIVE